MPPGGAGSAARTPARLLVLSSPAAWSDLLGQGADSLEDESSTGKLLVTLNSESWTDTDGETEISELNNYEEMIILTATLLWRTFIQNVNTNGVETHSDYSWT